MNKKPITVEEVSALIEAREETRAELLQAFEHWCELEAQVQELEQRLDECCGSCSEVRLRLVSISPKDAPSSGD